MTEKAQDKSIIIGWADNGFTDSLFTSSLSALLLHLPSMGYSQVGVTQTIGNQIARQRGDMLREFEKSELDWLLWLDSDIVVTVDTVKKLMDIADAETAPIVTGVYFISMEMNQPMMSPFPCIFTDDGVKNTPIHPMPENQVIPIDVAGLGFCLMHKSVAHKLREKYGNTTFEITIGDMHKSEDVSFFRKVKDLGIQVYAHTGALAWHIKRFVVDINYYNHWWNTVAPLREAAERARQETLEQMKAESIPKNDNNL